MNSKEQRKILITIAIVGFICLLIVVMTAYSAELQVRNNRMEREIDVLQGQVDMLDIKIKSETNVSTIETKAINSLGMVYPDSSQTFYISDESAPADNFAALIKEKAYN